MIYYLFKIIVTFLNSNLSRAYLMCVCKRKLMNVLSNTYAIGLICYSALGPQGLMSMFLNRISSEWVDDKKWQPDFKAFIAFISLFHVNFGALSEFAQNPFHYSVRLSSPGLMYAPYLHTILQPLKFKIRKMEKRLGLIMVADFMTELNPLVKQSLECHPPQGSKI